MNQTNNYNNRKNINTKNILISETKTIALLLVIFYHCILFFGNKSAFWPLSTGISSPAVMTLKTFLNPCLVPSLILCSGFLFLLSTRNHPRSRFEMLKNRAKRIIWPYFLYGALWLVPLYTFFDTTDNDGYISIPFTKLTSKQVVKVNNPISKEESENTISVVSRFSDNKNIKMYYNNGTSYSLKVYGDDAKLVGANQTVVIKLNKKTYNVKTNNKGVASLKIPNTVKPGTYTITVTYKGQTIKNTVKVLSRIAGNKNLNMYYYDGSRYSVKVYGKTGKLLSKQTVTIKINKKTYKVKSNSKGVASLKIPSTVKPGTYTIYASYAGLTVKNTVKVKQVLSSQKTKTVKIWWKKFTLTASLKNGKKALKGKKISFKFKGKTYSAKTNSKGIAKVTIKRKVIKQLKRGKSYKVSIVYLKNTITRTVKVKR